MIRFKKLLNVWFFIIACAISLKAQISSTHYLPPLKQSPVAGMQGQVIYLSTPETMAFDVNVYQGTSTTPITTISISNSAPGVYTPPGGTGANNSTIITPQNSGIVVSLAGLRFDAPSGKQFYMNWRAAEMNQGSSFVSLGKSALGTNFKWGGIPQVGFNRSNSSIGIMATEDNTVVKISGYDPNCTFSKYVNGVLNPAAITDDSLTITLNAFQTYTLESYATVANSPNLSGWLGANISSNKNIAVNQGHIYLSIANGDYSMTQIAPTTKIGKEYVLIRGVGLDYSEFPIVIATKDNTRIYLNDELTPFITMNNGQWARIPSSKYSQSSSPPSYNNGNLQGANMYIRTTENAYVFQFISAINSTNSDAASDVFQVAPLSCFLDNGVNNIPDVLKTGVSNINLGSVALMLTASSAITTNNISIKYGVGGVSTISAATLNAAKKTVRGTNDFVSYYIGGLSGDVSVATNGPVAVSYLGASGVVGVGGYFSGFGTIPTISSISQNICLNGTATALTSSLINAGYTYQWYQTNTPVNSGGFVIGGATASTYTPSTTTIGQKYYYVAITNPIGCTVNSNVSGAITVNGNTLSLTSSANTTTQTLCKNNPIANITYVTTGATGATVSGLPAGITGTWSNSVLTISGTPTVAGNYSYTVSTIGGCSAITATGTITVTNNNVTITSSAGGSTICPGTLVTFTANACNATSSTTYQWFKNGTEITGANSSTYSTTSLSNGDQIYVQLFSRVSNSISQSNLILNLDAGNTTSYQGSGNLWNDLSSANNNMNFFTDASYATANNPEFSMDGGGSLRLNNAFGKTINNTGITGAGPRTMSAWVKLDDLSPNDQTTSYAWFGNYGPRQVFEMMQFSSKVYLHYSFAVSAANTNLNPNQWYYITASYDGSTSKIYVNGVLDGNPTDIVISTDNTPLYIGSTQYWGSLKGKMASLDLYNVALTDQRVLDNYNATKSRFNNSNVFSSNSITTNVVGTSTFSLTSTNGTNAQTVCNNNSITPITYTTSGAISATITGLPSGVTGSFSNNLVTINGTPTIAGNYTFTVNLVASGCAGSSSFIGTITVLGSGSFPVYTVSVSGEPCVGQALLTATSGFVSYTWFKENTIINGATSNTYTPTSIGLYKVTVSNGVCATTSSSTTIYDYALTPEGKMMATNSGQLVSLEGAINSRTGLQEVGKIINIPNTGNGLTSDNASTSAYKIKRDYPNSTDGLYWIKNENINNGVPFQIYADMTTDGGGWTLLLTNAANNGWTFSNAIHRVDGTPSLSANYSIVDYGDYIKKSPSGFQYMMEATTRGRWGGIWTANGNYSFVKTDNTQTDITINTRFDNWNYNVSGIEQIMPWYANGEAFLTTSSDPSNDWWGTLISSRFFTPAPWLGYNNLNPDPGVIWYWVR